jgi:hypothetical protein
MASAVRYRISVRGRLTERLGSAFHGMILELISVEPSPTDPATREPGQGAR